MSKKLIICIALAAALCAWASVAQAGGTVKRLGLTVFSPLEVGQGARAVGMGGAFASLADDASTIWWNPAGMTQVERAEVTFSHTQWFVNSAFNAGAFAARRGVHGFGISFVNFDPGKVEERTITQPGGTGRNLSLGTVAVAGAYALKFTDKLSFGARLTWARESLDVTEYSTLNVDFGTTFFTGFKSLRLSMAMRNFGRDTVIKTRQFQQPLTFNLAGSGEVFGKRGDPSYATVAVELNYSVNYEERYHFGAEVWLMNHLALRGGYMLNYDALGLTAGAGVKLPFGKRRVTADFAYQEGRQGLNVPMRFSMGIGL